MPNAEKIGSLIEVEDPNLLVGTGKGHLRIRVALPISDSLVDVFWVPKGNGDRIWAVIRYERLLDFCFNFGQLGHVQKFCGAEISGLPRFGAQMRALLPRWVNSARGSEKHWSGENSIGLSRSDGFALGRVQGSMLKDDIQGTSWKDRLEEREARDRSLSRGISDSHSLHFAAEKNIYVKDSSGGLKLVKDTENFLRMGNFDKGDNKEHGTYELESHVVESPLVGVQIAKNNTDISEGGNYWALVEYDGKGSQSLAIVNSKLFADLRKLKTRKEVLSSSRGGKGSGKCGKRAARGSRRVWSRKSKKVEIREFSNDNLFDVPVKINCSLEAE
ncbi:Zinc knuckle CX2CX4HX4C [Corchorus olitorius]|uniref:Zinc knuckle CX2CX4HX4C n=1 Tax=Corchorus olitorius TaxID=93759 RepID=A0A1R3KJF5_9ROSI|nr:Zinc knuckle CX2CX4HX4C [Corchorus olitorius]